MISSRSVDAAPGQPAPPALARPAFLGFMVGGTRSNAPMRAGNARGAVVGHGEYQMDSTSGCAAMAC
jgi:hypothetical protein